jgi:hypothetical protein
VCSPSISPIPRPYLRVVWRSVPWVTWEAVTSVEGTLCRGYYDTRWLTELWSTQAKVQDIVPKAAWHSDSTSSVANDLPGETGCTPLYVCLSSAWGSVDGDHISHPLPPCRGRAPQMGTLRDMNELIHQCLWKRRRSLYMGTVGTMEGVCSTGDFERKVRFSFIKRPRLFGTPEEM